MAFALFWLIVGSVFGTLGFLVINRKLKWYVPTITNMELSKQLSTNLGVVSVASTQLASTLAQLYEPTQLITNLISELELAKELIVDVLKAQASKQLQTIHPDVIERIVRDVSPTVVRELSLRLQPAVNFASEYVLLHSLEDVKFHVQLTPKQYHAHELRQAIIRALEYRPRKLRAIVDDRSMAEQFMDVARDDQDLELFLGRVGQELLNLRLEGFVSLQRTNVASADQTFSQTIPITG